MAVKTEGEIIRKVLVHRRYSLIQRQQLRVKGNGVSMRQPEIVNLTRRAFTLIELLVVIAIIGLLVGLAMPVLHNFKPNYTASLTQQLLTDIARARQLAIGQHTTVYMVFVPTNFWGDPAYGVGWTKQDFIQASNLWDKQEIGYNFVTLRSLGDQPGRPTVHYLSNWKSLPEGGFIHPAKLQTSFSASLAPVMAIYTNGPPISLAFKVSNLNLANGPIGPQQSTPTIPFPLETTARASVRNPYVVLPYIAFDYMGRLVKGPPTQLSLNGPEVIPITRGSVVFSRDPNRKPRQGVPTFNELPVGNTTNGYNLVYIDTLTGRARALQQEVR